MQGFINVEIIDQNHHENKSSWWHVKIDDSARELRLLPSKHYYVINHVSRSWCVIERRAEFDKFLAGKNDFLAISFKDEEMPKHERWVKDAVLNAATRIYNKNVSYLV